MILWHNGTYKNEDEFHFHLSDRVRYGDGVFDTMLAVDGLPINPDAHLKRLFDGAQILLIPIPYAEEDFTTAAQDILRLNKLSAGEAVLNIFVSRGSAPRGLMPPEVQETEPEIIIATSKPPQEYPPVHAIVSQAVRRNEGSPLSQFKTFNYGDHIVALNEARAKSANEAILLNNADRIACGSAGNVYIYKNGQLLTPPLTDGAVAGTVRAALISAGFATEQALYPDDFKSAEGVFLSNSVRGLYPVMTLDGVSLPLAKLPIPPHFHTKINLVGYTA